MLSLNQATLDKQKAGIPLDVPEAREMVTDLQGLIAQKADATVEMLLLAAVSSKYYVDVWDLMISEGTRSEKEDPNC